MSSAPFAAALLLALFAAPAGGAKGTVWFNNIRSAEGWIEIDLEIPGGFPPGVAETLERGVPATVVYEIEIWRDRSRWFNRLEATQFLVYRIEHDAWAGVFRVLGPTGNEHSHATLAETAAAVLRPVGIRVAPSRRLNGKEPHYLAVRAAVRPLALEQVRAIEDWLEGKIPGETNPDGPDEGILRLPERLFGFIASLAGFGEQTLEARSINFRPEGLE